MTATKLLHLTNSLVTPQQLLEFRNRSSPDDQSIHFAQTLLTQAAGILLRLPQQVTATSLVLLQRHWIVNRASSKLSPASVSAASIYTTAKLSSTPLTPRSVINVYAYLTSKVSSPLWFINPQCTSLGVVDQSMASPSPSDPRTYYISEGNYEREKQQLFAAETEFLFTIGFDTHVCLPHQLSLTYLQTLGASSPELAERVVAHLNGALCSPQLVYLTHQPNALAVAAIYFAARETGAKLVEENWWEVFDVDREDLGFLVLAMGSLANFAVAEKEKWNGKVVPLCSSP